MEMFPIYILKSAFCLVLFYLSYKWWLSRETFHRFNRCAIGILFILSMLLPLADFAEFSPYPLQHVEIQQIGGETFVPTNLDIDQNLSENKDTRWRWCIAIAFIIYVGGIFFCLIRMLYSLLQVSYLLRSAKRISLSQGYTLVLHNRDELSPFSWFRYMVMSENAYAENGKVILVHEIAHIRQKHSFDLLLAGLITALQWFNPAGWLFMRELQNIHEYEADQAVLQKGIDAKQYQLLLIKKAVGSQLYSVVCGFTQTQLKKRITMMLKKRSTRWATLKGLALLPMAVAAVTVFARPEVADFEARLAAMNWSSLNLDSSNNQSGFHLRGVEIFGDSDKLPLIYIDGKKSTKEDLDKLDSASVKSFSILKDRSALEIYGEEGKNGAVLITLKSTKIATNNQKLSAADSMFLKLEEAGADAPMLFIDGKKSTPQELKQLGMDKVESFSILKGKSAQEVYGEEGRNGVILIALKSIKKALEISRIEIDSTKNQSEFHLRGVGVLGDSDKLPLIYIDEKKSTKEDLDKLDPTLVKSFSILKAESAQKVYGEEGKNGVVIIEMKKNEVTR